MLNVRDVVLGRVPDVLDRVVVGHVRRQMDRRDALQQPARLVEGGQRFRVVESCVVEDDCDLLCLGFALESFQRETPEETLGASASYVTGRAFDYDFEHLPLRETRNDPVS